VPLEPEHAVELIARLLRESADPVTLIPVGPLTNVALLLRMHPELTNRIAEIVVMGGSMGAGNVTPFAAFNIWGLESPPVHDPVAVARVIVPRSCCARTPTWRSSCTARTRAAPRSATASAFSATRRTRRWRPRSTPRASGTS
jgi:pyrimidine-specific ribonucleoside hydrolase